MESVIKVAIETEDVTDNQNAESSKKRSTDDRCNIIKQLSDGSSYKTELDSAAKGIPFKNEHFEELKDILKYMKGIINSYGLNHVFIKDIRSIIRVLDSRVWPNSWAICITRKELKDIIFRINTLQEYIHNVCFPNVGSKVSKFCTEALLDDHQYFDNKRRNIDNPEPMVLPSFIRGYHVYRKCWTPVLGETLSCIPEDDNKYDKTAVDVMYNNRVSGYVPKTLSGIFTKFLLKGAICAKVTGPILDRGYGLEVPVNYIFYGDKDSVDELVADIS